jgi:hypothetical protein
VKERSMSKTTNKQTRETLQIVVDKGKTLLFVTTKVSDGFAK